VLVKRFFAARPANRSAPARALRPRGGCDHSDADDSLLLLAASDGRACKSGDGHSDQSKLSYRKAPFYVDRQGNTLQTREVTVGNAISKAVFNEWHGYPSPLNALLSINGELGGKASSKKQGLAVLEADGMSKEDLNDRPLALPGQVRLLLPPLLVCGLVHVSLTVTAKGEAPATAPTAPAAHYEGYTECGRHRGTQGRPAWRR